MNKSVRMSVNKISYIYNTLNLQNIIIYQPKNTFYQTSNTKNIINSTKNNNNYKLIFSKKHIRISKNIINKF